MVNQSENKHEILLEIQSGIRDGRYKQCSHLSVGGDASFYVDCAHSSLINPPFRAGPADTKCPPSCLYFDDSAVAERQQRRAARMAALARWAAWPFRPLTGFFGWYSTAAWQTQVMLLVIALAFLAPRYLPPLAAFFRTVLHGD